MTRIDLINWTIQEANQLKSEQETNDLDGGSSALDKPQTVLAEPVVPRPEDHHPVQAAASLTNDDAVLSREVVSESEIDEYQTASPTEPVVPRPEDHHVVQAAVSLTNDDAVLSREVVSEPEIDEHQTASPTEPVLPLLKAIVAPDIYTSRVERDRAVSLRWALRDIKERRLSWSPVSPNDLQILIDFGLVEMRNDKPVLTNAGLDAIV